MYLLSTLRLRDCIGISHLLPLAKNELVGWRSDGKILEHPFQWIETPTDRCNVLGAEADATVDVWCLADAFYPLCRSLSANPLVLSAGVKDQSPFQVPRPGDAAHELAGYPREVSLTGRPRDARKYTTPLKYTFTL